jgi:hypothetical protein
MEELYRAGYGSAPHATVAAKGRKSDAGPLAQSVELCTYEVNSRYARVPSSILGGSTAFFLLFSSLSFVCHVAGFYQEV